MNVTQIETFLGQIYLDRFPTLARYCPEGQILGLIHKFDFELIKDKDEIKLKKSYSGEILNANNFCLTKYSGNGIFDRTARICMDYHEAELKIYLNQILKY